MHPHTPPLWLLLVPSVALPYQADTLGSALAMPEVCCIQTCVFCGLGRASSFAGCSCTTQPLGRLHACGLLQTGFFQGVVIPLYEQIADIFPGATQVLQQAKKNSQYWTQARAAAEAQRSAGTAS